MEEGQSYCDNCPYNFDILFQRIRDKREGFPPNEEILLIINRIFSIRRDIDILGHSLNELTEEEMVGLRILKDETSKFEQSKMAEANSKHQRETSRLGKHGR